MQRFDRRAPGMGGSLSRPSCAAPNGLGKTQESVGENYTILRYCKKLTGRLSLGTIVQFRYIERSRPSSRRGEPADFKRAGRPPSFLPDFPHLLRHLSRWKLTSHEAP